MNKTSNLRHLSAVIGTIFKHLFLSINSAVVSITAYHQIAPGSIPTVI